VGLHILEKGEPERAEGGDHGAAFALAKLTDAAKVKKGRRLRLDWIAFGLGLPGTESM
jgi:hypothetical protein